MRTGQSLGDSTGRGPGRPRRAETDRRIHEAALRLLRTGGPAAVTVEAVAAESGVAKTTIYRRYADREAVLRAALEVAISAPEEPLGNTPREKIRWALDQTWHQMAEVLGRGGVSAIVGNTQPGFTKLFRSVLTPYTGALVDLIRADMAAGELRRDLDPDTVVSLLIGAYLGELVRRGRVDKGFSERCVDLMWVAMSGGGVSDR
ncbi:TetR family transcriptional regulator [Nocardioides gansuensis]|uniref:TetR family transcriptional regulator n=1 Tax=Nocardioides gansuensis TaxID=2138300 RepID=A0A2T8F6Y5_9ACTN|nr:TetR/AcrR family transcriptional regulator [Nocardioides gansuensis]PVG81465.1 TetR family transcriptional regulator [Nocardioides gansuensis]